jgi:uncharacterized protein DUF4190
MSEQYPLPGDGPNYPPPPPPLYPPASPAPYSPPPAYAPPPPTAPYVSISNAAPMPMPSPTNGFATASLVFGILALCTGITAIPAVICGHIALAQINQAGGMGQGKGMAIAGLVIGYALIALFIVGILASAVSSAAQTY